LLATLAALVAGIAGLAFAADQFVLGAARVALLRRVSPLAVGILIVGFGTSAPELLVSVFADASGRPEFAIGNVVGSNLANLSMLLGIGAVLVPLQVESRTVFREALITLAATIGFGAAVQGGGIDRREGLLLLAAMVGAMLVVGRRSPGDPLGPEAVELAEPTGHTLTTEVTRTALGLVGTIGAAQLLLWGAVDLAERAGIAEGFVGATLVAVGTSLPELVTVIQSARRRETDLIVGNLLGSNLFNALVVGGAVGLIPSAAVDAPELTTVAALAAVGCALMAVVAMWTGRTVTRREGVLMVVGYLAVVPFLA
jgi:cation:H+ antiporter